MNKIAQWSRASACACALAVAVAAPPSDTIADTRVENRT
ncbi:hypothetical protein DM82_4033 [Burkholderia oklahomensis]|uniref:Uncharacterized protein n=1 Tax=Burkholderia oklahomensis TaxID=342113 RepID=A0AAI8FR29_9BURK|nr:hypothetical protein DM82_4033 [Burkholderia oklahomensis]AJX34142.1 hypothetical protein BG90_3994 [Burkholderia oklahomensis C6786]SUY28426.1 Uncharacterised protein [Burkholderia oklahomensis]